MLKSGAAHAHIAAVSLVRAALEDVEVPISALVAELARRAEITAAFGPLESARRKNPQQASGG